VLPSPRLPPRAVRYKELGDFFIGLRAARGWTQSHAADIAQRRELAPLTRQVLLRLERGQTKDPSPGVLKAIASLYEIPHEEVVRRLAAVKYGVSLTPDHFTEVMEREFGDGAERRARDDDEAALLKAWRDSTLEGHDLAMMVLTYFDPDASAAHTDGSRGSIVPRARVHERRARGGRPKRG
jgi:transcriptional regulator with XRE-family HTH domain